MGAASQAPEGITIGLYGDSGSGKTTQAGEYAKWVKKTRGLNTLYCGSDRGGYRSLLPLRNLGVMKTHDLTDQDDPWEWTMRVSSGSLVTPDIGLVIYDGGTSMSEALLSSCAKLSANGQDIGGRPAPKFIIGKGGNSPLKIGSNVDSHYGVVQTFMLDAIWASTWLTRRGVDVLWTFGVHRGEGAESTPILGPKLAGKALTSAVPKWFNYFLRLDTIPADGQSNERHLLYTQAMTEFAGSGMSFGNARVPLDAATQLPPIIEPASLISLFTILGDAEKEAEASLAAELGL